MVLRIIIISTQAKELEQEFPNPPRGSCRRIKRQIEEYPL